jgi:CMP-N,N'-diacetyllegionaminic acid synthase
MKICCIIPARAGSQGILHKNRADLCGKPLISWSIEQARAASSLTTICVVSDDPDIRTIATRLGVHALDRPPEISHGSSPSEEVVSYALDHIERDRSIAFDLVVFLQATSPLRKPGDIDDAVARLLEDKADSLFSGSINHASIWEKNSNGYSSVTYDYHNRKMRQSRNLQILENGSIYIFKPDILRRQFNRLGGKIACYLMEPWQSLEIDDPDDLVVVASMMRAKFGIESHPNISETWEQCRLEENQ